VIVEEESYDAKQKLFSKMMEPLSELMTVSTPTIPPVEPLTLPRRAAESPPLVAPPTPVPVPPPPPRPLDTKAALLSYLLPGLGQVVQGRVGKGVLFFVGLYSLFFYGLALGQMKNV